MVRRMMQDYAMGEIQKGPWKPEEDKVLINHVKKCGPREWSSIRSKGLLNRTGKSCRLRWVNKLRPNLKTGVKFSAEEERTVIDLQAKFGNKWAQIATYLPGRTDNDVKNFWSSRKKRLARILQASEPSSSSTKQKKIDPAQESLHVHAFRDIPRIEAPKFSSSPRKEPLPKPPQSSLGIKMVPFPDRVYQGTPGYEHCPLQLDYVTTEKDEFPEPQLHLWSPQIPQFQPDFPPLAESQDFITQYGEPSFLDEFEQSSGAGQLPIEQSIFVPEINCQITGREEIQDAVDLNNFINDFPPIDIFDDIEKLPSPTDWS